MVVTTRCCSFADGFSVDEVQWDTDDGHYRVRLHGQWVNVPNSSVVTEPNRYGPAVVWPYMDTDGNVPRDWQSQQAYMRR